MVEQRGKEAKRRRGINKKRKKEINKLLEKKEDYKYKPGKITFFDMIETEIVKLRGAEDIERERRRS